MKEFKATFYAGSDPFGVTFRKAEYMAIITHTNGKQTAEFFAEMNDMAYIGLSEWDDYEEIDYYRLDETGHYVAM